MQQVLWMSLLISSSVRRPNRFVAAAFTRGWGTTERVLSNHVATSTVFVGTVKTQVNYLQHVSLHERCIGGRKGANQPCSPFSTTTLRLASARENNDNNDNWKVPETIHIPEESLDMSFVRSSGSGGQNVNKVNTQVQIKVLIDAMGYIPYEVRERLRKREAKRINKEGYLVIQVQEFRTQVQNRKAAVQKLREMILQAWPRPKKRNMRTGLSEKTKKQRREDKRKRKLIKESRRPVDF